MANVLKEITLDLENDEVQGWASPYPSASKILDYTYRNFMGEKAPRIEVVKKNGVYQICFGYPPVSERQENYGGHHRAISHDISKHLLECYLMNEHESPEGARFIDFTNVKNIKVDCATPLSEFYHYYSGSFFRRKLQVFPDFAIRRFVAHHKFEDKDSERLYDFLVGLKSGNST